MTTPNRTGVWALTAALLLAPLMPLCVPDILAATQQEQQSDVPSDAEQAMFSRGQTLYNQGRYDQAATVLKDFLKNYPNSIITDLTLLWLGRSYMQLGKFQDAEAVGQRLRTIKDTPFAEIYEGEMQAARREASARRTTTTTTTPPTTEAKTTATPVAAQPKQTPAPVVTPTPYIISGASANTSAQSSRRTTNNPGLTINNPPPSANQSQANTSPEIAQNPRGRRRRGRQVPPQQALTNTNQSRTVTSPSNTNANANTQLAVNTPPRNTVPPVATQPTTQPSTPTETPSTEPSQPAQSSGLTLTVRQVPSLALALRKTSETASPGALVQVPVTITNTGNKEDQFRLETDLPAEYQPAFSLAGAQTSDTGLPILVTPQLARGGSIEVMLKVKVPETATDGQQRRFFVRAASQSDFQVLKIVDGAINVAAPALSANSNVSQASVMPGDTFTQTIMVRNIGSTSARSSRADFVFNPNFELVKASPAPVAYDPPSRTAIWALGDLGGRDSKEITVTLRALPEAMAGTNPLGRGMMRTQSLPYASNFDSPTISVGKVPRVRVDAVSPGLTVTPGDTNYIPFVVRNLGNSTDAFELRITGVGAPAAVAYADTNGDGLHQDSEPIVTQTPPLAARDGQFLMLLKVPIPSNAPDRTQYNYSVVARSLASGRVANEASSVLTVGTPRVLVRTEQVSDSSAPGDAIYYRLVLVNQGSGLAKNLVVTETLPEALEFVNSDPTLNQQDAPGTGQKLTWRVADLAPGDTAVLRIGVRLRPNLPADTNLTTRHTLSYQDSNGNSYQQQ
ncbi:MAG TPA: tetratricopeptide repeat protein [Pyrinomonadaceae bacterium]|nr:tetratricopeptide repeat protein [Pyrinomonadaceae bacterium]